MCQRTISQRCVNAGIHYTGFKLGLKVAQFTQRIIECLVVEVFYRRERFSLIGW